MSGLTFREQQVYELILQGHRPAEIGGELGIRIKTVEAHVAHIALKLRTERGGAWGILSQAYRDLRMREG